MNEFEYVSKYVSCKEARLVPGQYMDASIALSVVGDCGGGYEENISTVTVCMVDYNQRPAPGHAFIRLTGPCEGALECLQKAGVVGQVVRQLDAGFVDNYAAECPVLLPELLEYCGV